MASILPNAVRVSPTIKLARWSLLGLGLMCGCFRQGRLQKREDKRRAIEEAERPAKEAAKKAEKDIASQAELAYLQSIGIAMGPASGGSGGKSGSGGGKGGGSGGGGGGGSGGSSSAGGGPPVPGCDPSRASGPTGLTPDGKYKSECGCTF